MSTQTVIPSLLIVSCTMGFVRAEDAAAIRFPMNPYHANIGRVAAVEKDGTLQLADVANPRFVARNELANKADLVEGTYLGFVGDNFTFSTEDTRLVKLDVVEVGPNGTATVRVSPRAAAGIEKGEHVVVFRPPGSTTKQLDACPDYVTVDDGRETTVFGDTRVVSRAGMSRSKTNLKQIAIAFHNYHDVYGHLPPAVLYGPDGKPWHSWRVLILPYIEESPVYERYRFDEPWDGPNNSKLLAEMPEVYRDVVHGDNPRFYTHYAVPVGKTAAFLPEGAAFADKSQPFAKNTGTRFRDFTDGTSNTILIGTVGPEAKIPWMKPEDVVFGEKFPRPGEKGSFAAPYETRRGSGGMFAYADGSVRSIRSDVHPEAWQHLVERNDGFPVDDPPSLDSSSRLRSGPRARAMQFVEIVGEGDSLRARLVSGAAD